MHELANQVLSHLKAAWQYRWYAAVLAWVVAVGGWITVTQMPNLYEASARVYVDTQSVLRPLLAGVAVQPDVNQLVAMMSRTLITRPNVDKVIRMADMDIKIKTPDEREQMITRLTKELTIKGAGENIYTIALSDTNPQQAKRIVQSLLTLFVEGSIGDKRKDSDSAKRFIDDQLKAYSDKLVAAENAVTEFKRHNMGIMQEGRSYYTRLVEAQNALNEATLELKEAENGRDAIKQQLEGEVPMLMTEQDASDIDISNPQLDERIKELQKRLDGLRLQYTEQHPDIISTGRMIDQLKKQKQQEAKLKKPAPTRAQTQNPVLQQLSVSLAAAEASVASMKARVAEYDKRLTALKAAVNAVPQIDAEYTQLTRDYEVTKKNYESLLTRRETAEITGDMEANTSVINFRVIDPPQVPSVPSAPNRPRLISMVLLVALAGGAGFAFLLSQVRPTFSDERRLREVSGLPVFGTVIMDYTEAQLAKRKKGLIALVLSFLSLLSAYAAIMAMLLLTTARV